MQNIYEKNSVPNYFWGNFDSCSNSFAFIHRFITSRQKQNAFFELPYLKGFWSITDEEQPTPPKDDDLREPLFPNAGIFFFVTNSLTCMLQSLEPADFRLKSFFFFVTTLSWAWAGLDEGPPLQKKWLLIERVQIMHACNLGKSSWRYIIQRLHTLMIDCDSLNVPKKQDQKAMSLDDNF